MGDNDDNQDAFRIVVNKSPSNKPDAFTRKSNELDKSWAEIAKGDYARTNKLRHRIAIFCGGFVSVWLISVVLIIYRAGVQKNDFSLSDPVLLALLGVSTLKVISSFWIVMHYLFDKKHIVSAEEQINNEK